MKTRERKDYVVYEYFFRYMPNIIVYVGSGDKNRPYDKRTDDIFNQLISLDHVGVRIIKKNLTKGESLMIETLKIAEYKERGMACFNKNIGTTGYEDASIGKENLNNNSDVEILIDMATKSTHEYSISDNTTPNIISNEIINTILNSSNFSIENKSIFNPCCRTGEFYHQLINKVGNDVNFSFAMLDKDRAKLLAFNLKNISKPIIYMPKSGYISGERMNCITLYYEDFNIFKTSEKYDIIILNPPFIRFGEKFIKKCITLLKDGGFLGVVMSPTWRSISSKSGNQMNKTYTKMLKEGGFHYIHMYSADDTTKAFNKSIGQVDTFVWQKGVKINNTRIVNVNGDEFYYDLANYPQTPPVLPSYVYDKLFDQVGGLKWDVWTHPRDNAYGPVDIEFMDKLHNRKCYCNSTTVEKTKGKKIMVDENFSKYFIDNIGNEISASHYTFYYNTDNEKDAIVKTIKYLIDNNITYLFKNRSSKIHTFIPGIKIND